MNQVRLDIKDQRTIKILLGQRNVKVIFHMKI